MTAMNTLEPTLRHRLMAFFTRRYPLLSGCASIPNSGWFARWTGEVAGRRAWAAVPGGDVDASLDDFVGRAAFFMGDLYPKLTWVCRRLIQRGDTVLDIGANIGIMTVLFSRLVGSTGTVHAFEPNPVLQVKLKAAVERNGATNVKLHGIALGAENGALELCIPSDNSGQGSLLFHADRSDSHRYTVQVRKLAEVLGDEQIQAIRLVKLDVEGFESHVLEGA